MKMLKATAITSHTLVGGMVGDLPFKWGNCFSVTADDGHEYKIVNFVYENLQEILQRGITFPIQICKLADFCAIFHDTRIPDEWYPDRFCEVCCPEELLPLPQKLQHERQEMQGVRTVYEHYVSLNYSNRPTLPVQFKCENK